MVLASPRNKKSRGVLMVVLSLAAIGLVSMMPQFENLHQGNRELQHHFLAYYERQHPRGVIEKGTSYHKVASQAQETKKNKPRWNVEFRLDENKNSLLKKRFDFAENLLANKDVLYQHLAHTKQERPEKW